MPQAIEPWSLPKSVSYSNLFQPIVDIMKNIPELQSRGNRPLKMSFEEQLQMWVYFH